MLLTLSDHGAVQVSMSAEEAAAVCDDLGGIYASEVSAAGDQLHGLLENTLSGGA